jgi:hypothetical protein
MHQTPALSDNETVIEFVSSHTIKALKKRKARRRAILVLVAIPKILAVLYFGVGEMFESRKASAADAPVAFRAAPFVK